MTPKNNSSAFKKQEGLNRKKTTPCFYICNLCTKTCILCKICWHVPY